MYLKYHINLKQTKAMQSDREKQLCPRTKENFFSELSHAAASTGLQHRNTDFYFFQRYFNKQNHV